MSSQAQQKPEDQTTNDPQDKDELTVSERFVGLVERQWNAELADGLEWTSYEKTLAQHTFLAVDAALRDAETKRLQRSDADRRTAYNWNNVDLEKLAFSTVHHVGLGVDALLPNHQAVVFYYNKHTSKYDAALQLGYAGKDYVARTAAVDPPLDIVYHLVHENDNFRPIWRSREQPGDSYEFTTPQPFSRGDVIGGFGYVIYDDDRKNRLYLVDMEDFRRAEDAAKTREFWGGDNRQGMQYKTVVRRVSSRIQLDPRKVNARCYAQVISDELHTVEDEMEAEMAGANQGDVIDITPPAPEPDGEDQPADSDADAGDDEGPGF